MITSLVFLAVTAAPVTSKVTLSWDEPWTGWGCSLAWWANILGNSPKATLYADLVFGEGGTVTYKEGTKKLPGLKLNVVRYNIGGGGPGNTLTPNTTKRTDMIGFWQKPWSSWDANSWQWQADAAQQNMLKLGLTRGVNTVQLFSDSPMWWMTKSKSTNGAYKREDNLPVSAIPWFTHYLTQVAKRFRGLKIHSVEPFNEPTAYWWNIGDKNGQEGCIFSRDTQALVIDQLRKDLDAAGLKNLPIAASDENDHRATVNTLNSFKPEIRAAVGLITSHSYLGQAPNTDDVARDDLRKVAGSTPIWMSEFGDHPGDGRAMARTILRDLYHLRPQAWCYWQPIEPSSGWGLINVDYSTFETTWVYTKYFVYANFTRYIRPGMFILRSDNKNFAYAYDRKASKLVIVFSNENAATPVKVDLSAFRSVGPVAKLTQTVYGEMDWLVPLPEVKIEKGSKSLEFNAPADSILSIEIPNTRL